MVFRELACAVAVLAIGASAFAQKAPAVRALPLGPAPARGVSSPVAGSQSRILWIRNDKTGQVIDPLAPRARKGTAAANPITIYNNYDNPNGITGINLNWNYPDAYTNPNFVIPEEGDPLRFKSINLSSDPSDIVYEDELVGGERLSLMFEPYTATGWPSQELNDYQPLTEYTSAVASYSDQFEIRVCRIYFFALQDVTQPFDAVTNKWNLDLQLSFAFVSFAFSGIESPFTFDLSDFDPALTIKGTGLVLTHWLKYSQPPPCPADLNGDQLVEDQDFVLFVAQYNVLDCADEAMPEFCSADLNFDGFVDDADFVIFVQGYNDLLCPPPFVIKKAYAPMAGGVYQWDNDQNLPEFSPLFSEAKPVAPWPFPTSLVQVPLISGTDYPPPFEPGCSLAGCEPSFYTLFSTLTGFHRVNELNMEADNLTLEYERFINEATAAGSLEPFWFYDYELFVQGGFPNTVWYPPSSVKRIVVTPPSASK